MLALVGRTVSNQSGCVGTIEDIDCRYVFIRNAATEDLDQYVVDALIECHGDQPRLQCMPPLSLEEKMRLEAITREKLNGDAKNIGGWTLGRLYIDTPDNYEDPDQKRYMERLAQDLE